MPRCSKCGIEIDAARITCTSCGAEISSGSASKQLSVKPKSTQRTEGLDRSLILVMILPIFAINAYLSYVFALFSMSMIVISIFAATNVICLAFLLYYAFMKRAWTALLFVFIPIPAGFLIVYIMLYFQEFTKNVI